MVNIAHLLTEAARRRPEHPALLFEGREFSYEELDRLSDRFANALGGLRVVEGGVVAIFLESCPELVIAYLGTLKAGGVPNVVNGFLRPDEVRNIVRDSGADILITEPGRRRELEDVAGELGTRHLLVTGGPSRDVGDLSFDAIVSAAPDRFEALDLAPDALANLLYTSGTTGNPKGVMLSHRNVVDNARNFGAIHYTAEDRLLIAAPLFHCWGLINGVLATCVAGGTAIVVRRFQTEPVLDLIERDRPTVFMGVPTMVNYMIRSSTVGTRDLGGLRLVLCAAAPMPLELIEALRRDWKVGFAESYGLTETSPVITTTHHSATRPGSCGRAMGDTTLKVADASGRAMPIGEIGELWAHGTAISSGYFGRPDATAAVFTADGWFRTGDIARVDDHGYVTIVDRLKDMINVAGEKVYPRDVEEVLHRHPAVADAVVLGVPDPDRGESVKAYVALRPGHDCSAEALIDYLRPLLAAYKVPRSVELVATVPRSASGKALRRLLR